MTVEPEDHEPGPPGPDPDGTYTLNVGFAVEVEEEEAKKLATEDWHRAVLDAGYVPVGDVCAVVVRDNPNRAAVGEYMVAVAGERAPTDAVT